MLGGCCVAAVDILGSRTQERIQQSRKVDDSRRKGVVKPRGNTQDSIGIGRAVDDLSYKTDLELWLAELFNEKKTVSRESRSLRCKISAVPIRYADAGSSGRQETREVGG